jgi:hypothetical protein
MELPDKDDEIDQTVPLKLLNDQGLGIPTPRLPGKPIRVQTARQARRLMSRLILEFQRGSVDNKSAKDLAYLIIAYLSSCKSDDLEERVEALEKGGSSVNRNALKTPGKAKTTTL